MYFVIRIVSFGGDLPDVLAEQKSGLIKVLDSMFMGKYNDKWFGDFIISKKAGGLWMASIKSPRLNGYINFYKGNTFIVRWTDRSFDADAFVSFTLDKNGKADGFKMESISPLTDFSFDFQDLEMKRVNDL